MLATQRKISIFQVRQLVGQHSKTYTAHRTLNSRARSRKIDKSMSNIEQL
jgi:hypothetical protein